MPDVLSCSQVKQLIEEAIPGASAEVSDLTGTSDHFKIKVEAGAFEGKSILEQHKMVHAALGEHLTREIHSVEIEAVVPQGS